MEIVTQKPVRRLVALMFTDMVGYSRLSSENEQLALELLEEHRALFRKIIPAYGGMENKTVGDAFFIEFGSAVEAVSCAIEIQTKFYERQVCSPKEQQVQVRIGIHLGDIIDFEGDSYGDGVNIAARVENKAEPGGVFITQQVLDQVQQNVDFPIEKVGLFQLKNIAKPTAIYRVCFPWEPRKRTWKEQMRDLIRRALLLQGYKPREISWWQSHGVGVVRFWILACLLLFTTGIVFLGVRQAIFGPTGSDRQRRAPAVEGMPVTSAAPELDLSTGWTYRLQRPGLDFKEILSGELDTGWQEFDPRTPHRYSEMIAGEYWLKKEFKVHADYVNPAIFLGLIASNHRVFLNGTYIGGSTNFSNLEFYTFDSRLLKKNGLNRILVWGRTKPVLNPGINYLPEVGSVLAELATLQPKLTWEKTAYIVFRSVYLAFAFLMTFLCGVYYLVDRKKSQYLYFAAYLGLGSLALIYYNSFLANAFDYEFRRFIKVFALSMSSFVLLSAYLHVRKRYFYEMTNNVIGVIMAVALAAALLWPEDNRRLMYYYNAAFNMVIGYSVVWILGVIADAVQVFRRPPAQNEVTLSQRFQLGLIVFFGVLTGFLLYIGSYYSVLSVPSIRIRLQDIGMTYPFMFGMVVFIAGLMDYIEKSRVVNESRKRENLILNVIKIIRDSKELGEAIKTIQDKVCRFIHAERSTIFLLGGGERSEEKFLKASYFFGASAVRHLLEKRVHPKDGVIGYAWMSRAPLLIRDIRRDLRFQKYLEMREQTHRYKTASCMIFPLIVQNEIIGILTVADKSNGGTFSREDFTVMHSISKDIALLVNNTVIQERLRQYLIAQVG